MHIDQIDLIGAITKHLSKRGAKKVVPRQFNTVIAAANMIVAAYEKDFIPVTKGMTINEWMGTDECGASSQYVAYVSSGMGTGEYFFPRDADDFSRVHKLVTMVQGMENGISRMSGTGPEWSRLAEAWPELTALFEAKQFKEVTEKMRETLSATSN